VERAVVGGDGKDFVNIGASWFVIRNLEELFNFGTRVALRKYEKRTREQS
jgi:hypothetical protein